MPVDATRVGSVDDAVCQHGRVHPLASDPPAKDLAFDACGEPGVLAVPGVCGEVQTVTFCGWHLARYLEAHPDRADLLRDLLEENPQCYLPNRALIDLEDAPDELDWRGDHYLRVGLDQRGRAHYARRSADWVLVVDANGLARIGFADQTLVEDVGDPGTISRHRRPLKPHLERVQQRVGWAAYDDRLGIPTEEEDA